MYTHLSRKELIRKIEQLERELDLLRGMSEAARSVSPGAATDTPQNRMYDELFEFLPLPAFETDADAFLTRVNARSLARFGYSPAEVLHKKRIYDVLRADSFDRMVAGFEARKKGIKSTGNEYVAVSRDDSEFEVLIYSDGIFIDGVFQGIRGVLIDISERVAIERERNRLADQLRHARRLESVGRLAAGVAHDFNNLLSPIIGYSEVVIEQLGSSHPIMEDMKEILASAHSAREITQQLLTFGQKQRGHRDVLDLNQVIQESAQLMRRLIPENIFIEYKYASGPCQLVGDNAQMKQILLNLFINASDAICGIGRINVSTRQVFLESALTNPWNAIPAGNYVVLNVHDTGMGIDEDTQKHIFEPFFSTKNMEGSGLGLSTVWGITRQHEGYVMVESEKSTGTLFSLWFPALLPTRSHPASENDASVRSVLVVDDDERMCRLVRRLLTQQGFDVTFATSVRDAREAMHRNPRGFHLLLADVILPELDGKRLAAELTRMAPQMKVLFMTGYGTDLLIHCDLGDEPNLLRKPFDVESLVRKVNQTLQISTDSNI